MERSAINASYINGLGFVVVASGDGELNAIAFKEGAVTFGSDGRLVNEEIFTTIIGFDETETLAIVEPLDYARESLFGHGMGEI